MTIDRKKCPSLTRPCLYYKWSKIKRYVYCLTFRIFDREPYLVVLKTPLKQKSLDYLEPLQNTILTKKLLNQFLARRGWTKKKVQWAKFLNRHSSKTIWVIELSFFQNDPPMRESFWQKDSLITYIPFELPMSN